MQETINGLLTQKPGRDPQQGEIKLFTIEHRKGKSGKQYIKIKNATSEMGGQPYRILSAEKTDFVDQHGNISFSIEVEASSSQPSAFQQTKAAMQDADPHGQHGEVDRTATHGIQRSTIPATRSTRRRWSNGSTETFDAILQPSEPLHRGSQQGDCAKRP